MSSLSSTNKRLNVKLRETDIILNRFAAEAKRAKSLSDDKLAVMQINTPYLDSIMTVNAYVEIDRASRTASSSSQQQQITITETPIIPEKGKENNNQFIGSVAKSIGNSLTHNNKLKNASCSRFIGKYPRFCSGINFSDGDLLHIQPKSDIWIAMFMEVCYDEALRVYNTLNKKPKLWHGLNFGSIDAFPLVVQRYIAKRYSVLEIRKSITLEILYTIELVIERSEFYRFRIMEIEDEKQSIDGGRTQLFSKFLSEEYDIDVLGMFLQCRELVQNMLGMRLKDANPIQIWTDMEQEQLYTNTSEPVLATNKLSSTFKSTNSLFQSTITSDNPLLKSMSFTTSSKTLPLSSMTMGMSNTLDASFTKNSSMKRLTQTSLQPLHNNSAKIVPIKLPKYWYYQEDTAMPDCPLVSCESNILEYLMHQLLPLSEMSHRRYAINKCLELIQLDLKKKKEFNPALSNISTCNNPHYLNSNINHNHGYTLSTNALTTMLIPVYTIFRVVCSEWKRLPPELMDNVMGIIPPTESLKLLHFYYENGCQKIKEMDQYVLSCETDLSNIQSLILKHDKALRQLEKKRKQRVMTEINKEENQLVRDQLNDAQVKR